MKLKFILAVISVLLVWAWLAMTATIEILELFIPMITLVLPTLLTIVYIYVVIIVRRNNHSGS